MQRHSPERYERDDERQWRRTGKTLDAYAARKTRLQRVARVAGGWTYDRGVCHGIALTVGIQLAVMTALWFGGWL